MKMWAKTASSVVLSALSVMQLLLQVGHVDSRLVGAVVRHHHPPRKPSSSLLLLTIVSDSVSALTLFPYKLCWEKDVRLDLSPVPEGDGDWWGPVTSVPPCRHRVRSLVLPGADKNTIGSVLKTLKAFRNVENITVVKNSRKTTPASEIDDHVHLERVKLPLLRHLDLRDLEKGSGGYSILGTIRVGKNFKSLSFDGCDLRDTMPRVRSFLESLDGGELETLSFSDVEVDEDDLANLFRRRLDGVRSLVLNVNGNDMIELSGVEFWGNVGASFPNLEELTTNLRVSEESLGELNLKLGRLKFLKVFMAPTLPSGTVDVGMLVRGARALEVVEVNVFCKEPQLLVLASAGGGFGGPESSSWPSSVRVVRFRVSRNCDVRVDSSWMRVVRGSRGYYYYSWDYLLIRDVKGSNSSGDQEVVLSARRRRRSRG